MLFQYSGICKHCAEDYAVLVDNKGTVFGVCADCGIKPLEVTRLLGLVYIVSNPNQRGVKVGLTKGTMEQRLRALNGTSVPGDFAVVAIFPSKNPKRDEEKVHDKLKRFHLAKEHFDIDPVEAALKAYRALNRREPIFYDSNYREEFQLQLEKARIDMKLRLRGALRA